MVYRPTHYELMMRASSHLDVRARRMSNGMGIYANDCMFAFLTGQDIGLKLSSEDVADLLKLPGAEPFRVSPTSEPMREYFKIPHTLLDDFEKLSELVQKSAEYAQQKSCACTVSELAV